MSEKPPYKMTVDLNVIKHLGVGLYNSNPAVIAEAVANSWDADATRVDIDISDDGTSITIEDNGHGMSRDQVNDRFLHIGYERRRSQGEKTEGGRLAMGRKGIGKLSLFAIADDIYIYTRRADKDVEAFRLNSDQIREQITTENSTYHPEALPANWDSSNDSGTKIILRRLKKDPSSSGKFLRERLARRFSIIGDSSNFHVYVNKDEISVSDRGYLKYLEYVWHLGKIGSYAANKTNASKKIPIESEAIEGWVGTVGKPSQLKEQSNPHGQSANGIVVMVRGRVAHENILDTIGEAGLYAQYVVGELHADYLDPEDGSIEDDLITSSRQLLREDDPRILELRENIRLILKEVEGDWTSFRNEAGVEEARSLKSINEWFDSLDKDSKSQATKLFGKINSIRFKDDSDEERANLFRYGVIAFEKMRAQKSLSNLEEVDTNDVQGFLRAFQEVDEVEAALYHETVRGRIEIIKNYKRLVDQNALEKVLQEELFKHLWLLDPSWDRATGMSEKEITVSSYLKTDKGVLDKEIENSRMDIVYRHFGGTHAVIEMKRPSVVKKNVFDLLSQIDKYRTGLKAHLNRKYQIRNPFIRTIIIIEEEPSSWVDPDVRSEQLSLLHQYDAEIITYKSLLEKSSNTYKQFLDHDANVRRISAVLTKIQNEIREISLSAN